MIVVIFVFLCNRKALIIFLKIFEAVVEKDSDVQLVRVFGELFGGDYPHKEVQKVQGVRKSI